MRDEYSRTQVVYNKLDTEVLGSKETQRSERKEFLRQTNLRTQKYSGVSLTQETEYD